MPARSGPVPVFPLRAAKKASIYRNEVTQAATQAVLQAVERFAGGYTPTPLSACTEARGRLRPLMHQADRAIDWQRDETATVLRKINAADGFPGVADSTVRRALPHLRCLAGSHSLRGAWRTPVRRSAGAPRNGAVLRKTSDGAVWIGHVKRKAISSCRRRWPLPENSGGASRTPLDGWWRADHTTWQDIAYEESGLASASSISSSTTERCRPPSAGACAPPWPGRRPAGRGAGLDGRRRLLVQWHSSQRDRAASLATGRRPTNPGTTSTR
jgi:hypothetical protein